MIGKIVTQALLCGVFSLGAFTAYAASIEGYWKSIDDATGEPLSLLEIKKQPNGTYTGVIVHRYANARGVTLTTCSKCPPPYKDKPLVGLEILTNFKDDPKQPNSFIDGRVLDAKSGKIYHGKGKVSADGRRLQMRGYIGVSMFGRTNVWIRSDKATP
ncbi:MAG: DUF2147 domain-containing protein [Acinetobacter sp.]|nr:MAG: DUF2147 domain-containing protein [Acinetobacter sp.]